MLCSTCLSELCYDTHTKCEACRGQVCSSDSFCIECEGWSADFRKLYLRHKHSLFTKRVSKKNRKEGKSKSKSPRADAPPPPPPSDDDASTASQESHVTSPVVFTPLNQDLINANLTVEQLQAFQHVDNVVEFQLQPSPFPPQSTTVVDTAFFERVNNMMNTFDSLIPLLTKVASDRRSPTAGASESVSLNPLASHTDSAPQVSVVAPQSPGLDPGPSSASSEPIASTSGLQQRHHDAFASPRGRSGERDSAERSRHASPSLQDRLRRQMDDVRRQLVNAKEIVDVYSAQGRLPPDQVRYDLEFFQDRYAQLHVAYEDSLASSTFHSHGPSPAPHVVASPGFTPIAATPGSSSLARPRSPYRFSSRSQRYDQRVASSDIPVHGSRHRSRESLQSTSLRRPSSQRRSTSRRSSSPRRTPPPAQRRVASRRTPPPAQRHSSRRTPSPTQRRVASKGSPPPQRVTDDPAEGFHLPRDLFLGVPSLEDGHPGTPSLQGEVPLLRNDGVMRRETLSPLQLTTHHGLLPESPRRKDQVHGLLLAKLPLPERRRKLTTLQFQPRLRPWWNSSKPIFRMPSPPRPRSSLGPLTSRLLSVLLTQRLPRDRFLAGRR